MTPARIKAEVDRRIVYSYDHGMFWWMKTPYNRAAVCGGNIGGTLLYLCPEKLEERLLLAAQPICIG